MLGKDVGIESVLKTRNIKIKRNPELNYGLIISLFDVDKPPGWKVGSHEGSQQRLLLHIFLGNHWSLIVPVVPWSRLTSALCLTITSLTNVELKVLCQRVDLQTECLY